MSIKVKSNLPLMVGEIRFGDGSTMTDQTVMICEGFLAVMGEDDSLSLYNLSSVEALIDVQSIQTESKPARAVWF